MSRSHVRRLDWFPLMMVLPAVILMVVIVAGPMLYSLYLSFTDFSLIGRAPAEWVGWGNYVELYQDSVFWEAFWRTIIFLAIAINLEMLLGLGIAHLIAGVKYWQGLARTAIMVPMMFPPILIGFQFKWFFNAQLGFVNNLLFSLTGQHPNIAWLVEQPLGFISILLGEVWMGTPFMVIIILAGLLSLPREPYEAAEIDGAGAWYQFWHITLPMVKPFLLVAMTIRSLTVGRAYDLIRIMTDGGPAHRTEMVWTYITELAISGNEFGLGSAMSYITVLLSFAFTIFLYWQLLKARRAR